MPSPRRPKAGDGIGEGPVIRTSLAEQYRTAETRASRRRKLWGAIWLAFAVAMVGVFVWRWWFPGRAFDAATWDDESQAWHGARLEMADRLLAQDILTGMTRAQVIAMLGEPSQEGYFREWDMVYWLGPERGFMSVDSEWLVLNLDGNGRVVECRIVND